MNDAIVIKKWFETVVIFLANKNEDFCKPLIESLTTGYKKLKIIKEEYESTIIKAYLFLYDCMPFEINQLLETIEQRVSTEIRRKWIYTALLSNILNYEKENQLYVLLTDWCLAYLIDKTLEAPIAPINYARTFPNLNKLDDTDILLKQFCEDADAPRLDVRRNEAIRNEIQLRVERHQLDISTSTIKIGSPHTLVLTKNFNTYNRLHKEYEEDLHSIRKLQNK